MKLRTSYLSVFVAMTTSVVAQAKQPNVVLILADDLG